MTHYTQFDLPQTATKMEIKKAYFKRMKAQPPERFPEEFKIYRKAYEVLMDDVERKRYDDLLLMPNTLKPLYEQAMVSFEKGRYGDVIDLLKAKTKDIANFEEALKVLGHAYVKNENPGLAVKIFERLHELQPENTAYLIQLARAYRGRKFHKKAWASLEQAMEKKPVSAEAFAVLGLLHLDKNECKAAESAFQSGLDQPEIEPEVALELYCQLIEISVNENQSARFEDMIANVEQLLKDYPKLSKQIAKQLSGVFLRLLDTLERKAKSPHQIHMMSHFSKLVKEMNPFDPEIAHFATMFEEVDYFNRFIDDKVIPGPIKELISIHEKDCPCPKCSLEIMACKVETLDTDPQRLLRALSHLKKNYPDFYEIEEDFFDSAQNHEERRRLKKSLTQNVFKEGRKQGIFDDDDYIPTAPIVREGPKVGRNDPCPCGSGKKYKKCCA